MHGSTSACQSYRVTHAGDPVPRLPPQLLGYRHPGPELHIRTSNGAVVSRADIDVYADGENELGSNAVRELYLADHSWYLGPISACSHHPMDLIYYHGMGVGSSTAQPAGTAPSAGLAQPAGPAYPARPAEPRPDTFQLSGQSS